ncbi:MAG: hemerythrin family protein [Planctomycetes bacterium]|nr:hemerythrin family protein [Planctomycetota bacterium]
MAVQWNENLSTGIDWQDAQHKELVARIGSLMEAMSTGKGKAEITNILNFLENYVVTHFSKEEEFMVNRSYPGYAAHKAEHKRFIYEFTVFKNEFEKEGSSSSMAIKVQRTLMDWLVNHIGKIDKGLGEFLSSNAYKIKSIMV